MNEELANGLIKLDHRGFSQSDPRENSTATKKRPRARGWGALKPSLSVDAEGRREPSLDRWPYLFKCIRLRIAHGTSGPAAHCEPRHSRPVNDPLTMMPHHCYRMRQNRAPGRQSQGKVDGVTPGGLFLFALLRRWPL